MSYGKEKKLNGNLPVVMKNELARGKYSMDLTERRLLYVAMSKIHPDDIEFGTVTFTISEYIKLLEEKMQEGKQKKGGHTYNMIKTGCKSLLKRIVEIQTGKRWMAFQWVSKAIVDENTTEITLRFHDEMKPYLLWMVEEVGFTKFLLKYALPLQSIYAQRFYEIFRGMVYEGNQKIVYRTRLQDLKQLLDIGNKYPNFNDFKRKVLEPAEREINGKTDLQIAFKEIRSRARGRRIEALRFHVQLKAGMNPDWGNFLLWDKPDLADKIAEIAQKRKGQHVVSGSLLDFSHEALARLTYELRENIIDLHEIKNCQAFFAFKLDQWSDEIGIRQQEITV
jgi:plasmid replication initiation protein